jgi:dihydrofolate synthase / folylpolyglutamate synthase
MLSKLKTHHSFYSKRKTLPRALDDKQLMKQAAYFNLKGKSYSTVKKALETARKKSNPDDLIIILGSTFVVAEVLP